MKIWNCLRTTEPHRKVTRALATIQLLRGNLLQVLCVTMATLVIGAESDEVPITEDDRHHWSFRSMVRPKIPVSSSTATLNPIDAFLEVKFAGLGLVPLGQADKTTLLRRVTYDLTGLPPSLQEFDDFLDDTTPTAYERVVDRILASPRYGERWAQHWLDLSRFAETDGFEFDAVRPNAWRYRDWVVQAFNQDTPFDRFVQQQVAGDELWPDDPQSVIATGFLLCGPDMPDINDQEERRHNVLNEMVGTVGSVFLGLSLGCAQCHDHKSDPISQHDFYRMRAYFDRADIFKDHPVLSPDERTAIEAARRAIDPLEKEIKELDDAARKRLRETNPDLQPSSADLQAAMNDKDRARRSSLAEQLSRLPKPPELPFGRVFKNGGPRSSFLAIRGDHKRRGAEVRPELLRVLTPTPNAETSSSSQPQSRADLARWLTRPDHPLVPRVMANRLWQFHFGEGLSRTVSDFGVGGSAPSHPELLDWLAVELSQGERGFKRMHRLLVTSAAYQRAAKPGLDTASRERWNTLLKADPENRLWGRMFPRRLEGEAIRDAMLSVAGVLSERHGGPGTRPPLPKELVATLLKNQWTVSPDEEDHRRRSIYLMVRRNLRYPLFEVFDRPDTNATCPRRSRTTVAPQALALLNSEFSLKLAKSLADRLAEGNSSPEQQIQRAFRLVFGRLPSDDELNWSLTFVAQESQVPNTTEPNSDRRAAMARFCLSLFNSNELLYID